MTKKRARPAQKDETESKVTKEQAAQVLNDDIKQRIATVQAAIQTVLSEQRCRLETEIVLNSQGIKSSNVVILPLNE